MENKIYPFHEQLMNGKTYEELIQTLTIRATLTTPKFGMSIQAALADGFHEIEKESLRINEIIMNARTYMDIRKLGHDWIDFETSAEKLNRGILAFIWGAAILVTKAVPDNTILLLPEPDTKNIVVILRADTDSYFEENDIIKLNKELRSALLTALDKQENLEKFIYQLTLKREENTDEQA